MASGSGRAVYVAMSRASMALVYKAPRNSPSLEFGTGFEERNVCMREGDGYSF